MSAVTKKIRYLIYFGLVVVIFIICLMHKTTIRFIDENGASIITDQNVRLIKFPFVTHVNGYKQVSGIHYIQQDHQFVAKYKPEKNPLKQVKAAHFIGVTFQPTTVPITKGTQSDPFILSRQYDNGSRSGRDTLRILIGESYKKMKVLNANYPAVSVRDPSIMKQGNKYYIIYTRGLMSTTDFNHWEQINWSSVPGFDYSQDWAPEFVQGHDGKDYVIMSMQKKGNKHHQIMITSFNNGKIGKNWVEITGNLPINTIDPNLQYANGQYYLFCKNENTRKLVMGTSNNLTGPYKMERVQFDSSKYGSIEGPEAIIHNGIISLVFDTYDTQKNGTVSFHGLHYVERNVNGNRWSKMKKINSLIVTRHGQIILN